jgi:CRISPR-associated protein Cmr6
MGVQSCRDAIYSLDLRVLAPHAANAGLMLARYLKERQDGSKEAQEAREELLDAAPIAARNASPIYKAAFAKRRDALGGHRGVFKADAKLIVGLGADNVIEAGLALNHIYGVPVIPGSSLKGLAAHYCSEVWGAGEQKFCGPTRNERDKITAPAGEHYDFMFGSTEDAGGIVFHDAWIVPDSLGGALVRDVMTPHHGNYYAKENGDNGQMCAPTDFDDPTPVTFLSVRGNFEIHVICNAVGSQEEKDRWEEIALELLKRAIEDWGAGGKTNSGYGTGKLDYVRSGAPAQISASFGQVLAQGQVVNALCVKINDKGNPQFQVTSGNEKITASWKGEKQNIAKGETVQAVVDFYNPNANPKLVLKALSHKST